MEVSSDANVVVEESPQTKERVWIMCRKPVVTVTRKNLSKKCQTKSQETRRRRSYCSVYPKWVLSVSLVLQADSVKFLQDSTKRMPTWAFFQAYGETGGKATASHSNAIPLRGTDGTGLHEPQVDTIQMAGTGLWPTTLRATGSQHEEANYAALDPGIPKFFDIKKGIEVFRTDAENIWEWWLFPWLGRTRTWFAFLGAMHFIDLLAGGVLASSAQLFLSFLLTQTISYIVLT